METYLAHHGILGMKWGVRRYQNKDGTLTDVGKRRYKTASAYAYASRATDNSDRAATTGVMTLGARMVAKRVAESRIKRSGQLRAQARGIGRAATESNARQLAADAAAAKAATSKAVGTAISKYAKSAKAVEAGDLKYGAKLRGEALKLLNDRTAANAKVAALAKETNVARSVEAVSQMQSKYVQAAQYASVARAATTVAGIVSGVGAVTTIGFGAIAAGQLAYSAYLKHQAQKV